jgi:hypothetical protein
MAEAKLPPLPVILLANDLLDGEVVFWSHEAPMDAGWTRDPARAFVARDEAAAIALRHEGQLAFARQEVVDVYLVDVTLDESGLAVPRHFRERFKVRGPSIRTDLGKQADYPHKMQPELT